MNIKSQKLLVPMMKLLHLYFLTGVVPSHPFPFCIPTHSALQEETAQRICNNNIRCRENFGQETAAAKHELLLPSLLRG
jgi:hypothetical protein